MAKKKPRSSQAQAKKKDDPPPHPELPASSSGELQPDPRLPLRLFAIDRFPISKLNIYSSPEILHFLRNVLRGTPEFKTIRQSCFGKLFDIPARQAPVSAKLIHSFLTRQLLCGDDHTLWSVFGGNPLCYGLPGTVAGLNCGSFPEGYHPHTSKSVVAGTDGVWKKLFGNKKMITIAELCRMLEKRKNMSGWKKIRIALIIIVDGILIAHKQVARPTPRYVSMLTNLKTFFAFPWGRESFLKTISCMKPPKPSPKIPDPLDWLVDKLKQSSFRLQGFPLTLQLVAFRAIPQLLDFIPAPIDQRTLMDLEVKHLPQHGSINYLDILRVEFSSKLAFPPVIAIESQSQPGWGEWANYSPGGEQDVVTEEQNVFGQDLEGLEEDVHNYTDHEAERVVTVEQNVLGQAVDDQENGKEDDHKSPRNDKKVVNEEQNVMGQDVDGHKKYVHNSTDHDKDQVEIKPQLPTTTNDDDAAEPENDIQTTPARDKKTTETRSFGILHPCRWDPPSKVYDKAYHPNSPEISHILHHGMTIYEPLSPETPLSRGPIFDQTAGQSSPPAIRLRLSPLPFTPLTSPVKSNESGLGFAIHAASPNAFKATASSNSPTNIGRPITAEQNLSPEDPTIDLTQTKDPQSHVPSHLETLLAKELFSSPLVPALDLITPLPDREWEIFEQVLKSNINVFHSTPSEFEFSNKSLLELAMQKQWTTTYQMEILVHMISNRHSDILQAEKAAFAPPVLCAAINEVYDTFSMCGKKKKESFVWDQRLVDIVLTPGKKWMDDIQTIYTPMLWNESHWVGLAINLDMGLVEVLDPLPALHGVRKMAKWMKPVLACLPYLVKKVAMCELTQFAGVKPFISTRIQDIYINGRPGDCGPVTMKFLEFHAHGDPPPGMAALNRRESRYHAQAVRNGHLQDIGAAGVL